MEVVEVSRTLHNFRTVDDHCQQNTASGLVPPPLEISANEQFVKDSIDDSKVDKLVDARLLS